MKILIIGTLICLSLSQINMSTQSVCACIQIFDQQDCINMPGCQWNNNACNQQSCLTYNYGDSQNNQNDCLLASKNCQWSNNKCSTFLGCQDLVAQTPQDCLNQNLQCQGFNIVNKQCQQKEQITYTCSQYPNQNLCDYNSGTDGVCIWQNNQCTTITQCSDIQQQTYCENISKKKNIFICQWNSSCKSITTCKGLPQNQCKYFISNQPQLQVTFCQWSDGDCVQVSSPNQLSQQDCLVNSGYTYRWISSPTKPQIGLCTSCNPVIFPSKQSCLCSQYVLEQDCNSQKTLCNWNGSNCQQNACENILNAEQCITVSQCYWNYQKTGGNCLSQNNCSSLPIKTNSFVCAAQSLSCAGFSSSNGKCQSISDQSTCSSQPNQQNCYNYISKTGVCVWVNGLCLQLQSCTQIKEAGYCGVWQENCIWNHASQTCEFLTCSKIKNESLCQYVLTGFQENQYQGCYYNKKTQTCQNNTFNVSLNAKNCNSNTGNTYRWSTNVTNQGVCLPCQQLKSAPIQINSSCACQQFINQTSCNNSGYCQFNVQIYPNFCQPISCSNINLQADCLQISFCYWQPSVGCKQFYDCLSLSGNNQLECISMNVQCKGYSNGSCQNYIEQSCAQIYQSSNQKQCSNSIGTDGFCVLSQQDQIYSCTGFSNCSQAQFQQNCEKDQYTCYWADNSCKQRSCSSFNTQLNCIFYFPSPLITEPIFCSWNSKINQCQDISNITNELNQQTCQVNTLNSYQWVNNKCLKCKIEFSFTSQCSCADLIYASDCLQSQECQWVNNECSPLQCSQILLQIVCASQSQCAWISGQCTDFKGQCSQLSGTNQQCQLSQKSCVGSYNNVCSSTMSNCNFYNAQQTCQGSIGKDGICFWSTSKNKCFGITQCLDFNNNYQDMALQFCSLYFRSCSTYYGMCTPQTCSQLYFQTGECTYIQDLISPNQIKSCIFISSEVYGPICTEAVSNQSLNQSNCADNSNLTARWNSKYCQSCSRLYIQVPNISQCQCSQYENQNDCFFSSNFGCVWNLNFAPQCQRISCYQVYNQEQCLSLRFCFWAGNQCESLSDCSELTSLTTQDCQRMSSGCLGFNSTSLVCTSYPTEKCSQYVSQQTCSGFIGSDGICYWDQYSTPNSCVSLKSCNQIKNQNKCNQLLNYCYFNNNQCQNLTCSYYDSPALCTFVYTNLSSQQIQLCDWNKQTSSCQNRKSNSSLNSFNCVSNTASTFRWISNQYNQGACISCSQIQHNYYLPGQCQCEQLNIRTDCLQNPYCIWSSSLQACQQKMCSQIDTQALCSTFPKCYWSKNQDLCQPFTSCNDLAGNSSYECASYSAYCAGPVIQASKVIQTYSICTPTQRVNCYSFYNKKDCIINITCSWDEFGCQPQFYYKCGNIKDYAICQSFSHSCNWQGNYCENAQCFQFDTKESCTYVAIYDFNYFEFQHEIQYCFWNGSYCSVMQMSQMNEQNCYSNTMMQYRWINISSQSSGICAQCNQNSMPLMSYSCSCQELSQSECAVSNQCILNSYTDQCLQQACSTIQNINECVQVQYCMWIKDAGCQQFQGSCNSYRFYGDSKDCNLFSFNCPIYLGSQLCGNLESCKTLNQTICEINNLCYWKDKNCNTITNCGQIQDIQFCNNQLNYCQWSFLFNKCVPQQCSYFISQKDCKFIYQSFQSNQNLIFCQWNSQKHICQESSGVLNLTNNTSSTECYLNSGGNYHEYNNNCVYCQSKSSIIQFFMLLLIIIIQI